MPPSTTAAAATHGDDDDVAESFLPSRPPPSSAPPPLAPSPPTQRDERHVLLDRALEEVGFGRFHAGMLAVVSFGTFVDATETALISIIFPMLQTAWAATYDDLALIGSLTSVGMMLGAVVWGVLSDMVGRKFVYVVTLVGVSFLAFLSSFTVNAVQFAVARLFVGFAYGGNTITGVTLMLELMPFAFRARATSYNSLSWGFGALLITSIGWGAGNAVGWAWLVRIPSLLSVPILIGSFWVSESPRWCIRHDEHAKAVSIMATIAASNKRPMPPFFNVPNLDRARGDFVESQARARRDAQVNARLSELSSSPTSPSPSSSWLPFSHRVLFSWAFLKVMLPLLGCWFFSSMGATLFSWLPLACVRLPGMGSDAMYSVAFTMACGNLTGCVLMFLLGAHFQRPTLLVWSLILCAGLIVGLGLGGSSPPAVYTLTFLAMVTFQVTINALYLYTPEVSPTATRTTVFGVSMLWHRLGYVIAPFILSALYSPNQDFALLCGVFSIFFLAAWLLSCALVTTTLGEPLKEEEDYLAVGVSPAFASSSASATASAAARPETTSTSTFAVREDRKDA